jgi:hypothetical protein
MVARALVGATLFLGGCAALPDVVTSMAESASAALAAIMPTSVDDAMSRNLAPLKPDAMSARTVLIDLAAPSGDGVLVKKDVITLSKTGSYTLSGSWAGQVVVDPGGGQVDLILDGASVASSVPGALVVEDTDVVVVHLAEGSENSLSDTGVADEDDKNPVEAALYSHATLILTGTGKLAVTSADGDAIASKDGLEINSGTYVITAGDDGIRGKDYLVISGGILDIQAGSKALKSTNTSDAMAGYVWVSGGDITAKAGDDCIHAKTDALISGGTLTFACGDDGVHADVVTAIDGGKLTITSSYEGIEGFYILLAGGIIDVTSSDDGVNAAGGTSSSASSGDAAPGGIPDGTATDQPWGGSGWSSEMPTDAPSGYVPGEMPSGFAPGGAPGGFGPGEVPSGVPTDVPTDVPSAASGQPGGAGPGTHGNRGPSSDATMPDMGTRPGGTAAGTGTDGGFARPGGAGGFGGGGFGGEGNGGQILLITGGDITINAEGDGLDSNGSGSMTGGNVTVYGPTRSGDGAIDVNTGLVVTGGTLLAVDSGGMSTTPGTASTQPWFSARASISGTLTISDSSGKALATYTLPKGASNVVYSSPDLVGGQTYTLSLGAQQIGTATAQ